MTYSVPKKPRKALIVAVSLGILSILGLYAAQFLTKFSSVCQLFSLLLAAFCIWILVRYTIIQYHYTFCDTMKEGLPCRLRVVTVSGRDSKTLYEIEILNGDRIFPYDPKNKPKTDDGRRIKLENVASNLFAENLYVYHPEGLDRALLMECSGDFADLLQEMIKLTPEKEDTDD